MAMNEGQVTQEKQQQAQVCVGTTYVYIQAYICTFFKTTTFNFSYKVLKSLVICKAVSKLVVIYAPGLGRLCNCRGQ